MARFGTTLLLTAALAAAVAPRTTAAPPEGESLRRREALENHAFSLGAQAYIYGFPLVEMARTERIMTSASRAGSFGRAPANQFSHVRRLLTPDARVVVTPNNDTLYSVAWLELADGPVVLHVPHTGDRYYVFQLLDAWTNIVDVIGKRTVGADGGDFVIVGPNWSGETPPGAKRIDAPTNSVWVIGRTLVDGEDDLPAVHALQDQYTLTLYPSGRTHSAPGAASRESGDSGASEPPQQLAFFQDLGVALRRNPPPASDRVLLAQFADIGLSVEHGFDFSSLDASTAAGLARAAAAADQIIEVASDSLGESTNGWSLNLKTGRFGDDHLLRAAIAKKGLGALVPEEAIYPMADFDGAGERLTGARRYVLHFAAGQAPPVDAFWSLSMYGADRFFVRNPLRRYSIGDRTPGLQYNDDGSLDLFIQREAPIGHESNWLPSPDGEFYLVLRAYLPRAEMLDGAYQLPAVERVD